MMAGDAHSDFEETIAPSFRSFVTVLSSNTLPCWPWGNGCERTGLASGRSSIRCFVAEISTTLPFHILACRLSIRRICLLCSLEISSSDMLSTNFCGSKVVHHSSDYVARSSKDKNIMYIAFTFHCFFVASLSVASLSVSPRNDDLVLRHTIGWSSLCLRPVRYIDTVMKTIILGDRGHKSQELE